MTTQVKMVGPVVSGMDGALAEAVITAIEDDNPGMDVDIDDQGGYIRIQTPAHGSEHPALRARRDKTRGWGLELEPSLAGFAGRMQVTDEDIIWYLERED